MHVPRGIEFVTSDGDIRIVPCLLLLYDKTRSSSVYVSFLFGVSKVSTHFILERSVETFHCTGFDVVIFREKKCTL